MTFSIITTCFNAGDKLQQTLSSIAAQTETDYEVVVKDAASTDGSLAAAKAWLDAQPAEMAARFCLYSEPDHGVYEGMNQALAFCRGEYVLFLNCGDVFYREDVLACVKKQMEAFRLRQGTKSDEYVIFYGNTYCAGNKVVVHSAPRITGFTCYRNIPCHQSCFYDRRLFEEKKYDLELKIRADYDHFLWCYYRAKASFVYMDAVIASYEGGGISESPENRETDEREHREITARYMSSGTRFGYRLLLWCTLAPLRRRMAESSSFSGIYHKLKSAIYR